MYPSLEEVIQRTGLMKESAKDLGGAWKTDEPRTKTTVQFAGRFIRADNEYLLAVKGCAYPVTFGPDLDEGQPESIENCDIQVIAELEPGEEIFANEFQPIHVIEIID